MAASLSVPLVEVAHILPSKRSSASAETPAWCAQRDSRLDSTASAVVVNDNDDDCVVAPFRVLGGRSPLSN